MSASSMEISQDRFWQAALTVEGKIFDFFDVTYAGAYMDRPDSGENDYADYTDAYDRLYQCYTPPGLQLLLLSGLAGNPLSIRTNISKARTISGS